MNRFKASVFFAILASGLFAWGAYLLQDCYHFIHRSIPTTATIVSLRTETRSSTAQTRTGAKAVSHSTTVAILKYSGQDGREALASVPHAGNRGVGDRIKILYDPKDSSRVAVDSLWSIWGDAFLVSAAAVAFGSVFRILRRKRINF